MSLWLLKLVFLWSSGFCGEGEKKNRFQRCQRSFWQSSYHSMSNCSSSRNDLDPPPLFFSHSASKQKTPHTPPHSLICLGGALLGRGSAWTERALPEDYRMGGTCVIVSVSIFVLEVCPSVRDECGVPWMMVLGWGELYVLGGLAIFSPSKCCNCLQDWAAQGANAHFPVYSLSPL